MNNLIVDEKYQVEAINIFNKFAECIKNPNDGYKFFDYINTILSDNKKYNVQEANYIKSLVFRHIAEYIASGSYRGN